MVQTKDNTNDVVVEVQNTPESSSGDNFTGIKEYSGRKTFHLRHKKLLMLGASMLAVVVLVAAVFCVLFWLYHYDSSQLDNQTNKNRPQHTVILISIDGLRWSYLSDADKKHLHPNLDRIIQSGVMSQMQSAFPTVTFPNHYSIVTGLYPESHGIVANDMYDPVHNATFAISDNNATTQRFWWGGEPIWVTAQKFGLNSACMFWPGSDVPGMLPTYYYPYNSSMPYNARVDSVLEWLGLENEEDRPSVVTLYFEAVDHAGHAEGPNSPAIGIAIQEVDLAIGRLLDGLEDLDVPDLHIIVTSDHGMASISTERVLYLEDYLDLEGVAFTTYSPNTGIYPLRNNLEEVYESLKNATAEGGPWWGLAEIYKREEIPQRFHYRNNDRIPPLLLVASVDWSVAKTRDDVSAHPSWYSGGTHGYDNSLPEMAATFLATGAQFKKGQVNSGTVLNVSVYSLMSKILDIQPALNNGTWRQFQAMMELSV